MRSAFVLLASGIMLAQVSLLLGILSLVVPAESHPSQKVITTPDYHHQDQDQSARISGFVSLGDSYSAGIGTPLPGPKEENCRLGTGAYPFLIARDLLSLPSNITNATDPSPFQWLSCTGSETTDLLSSPVSKTSSQIDTFTLSPAFPAFATVSIGGNDLGFFDVLNACIFRFYSFYSGTCESALAAADVAIASPDFELRLMLILREVLDKVKWERHPEFAITVTGYARFFNEHTKKCDDVSLGVWWGGNGITRGPKLTRGLRMRINRLVEAVNEKIRRTVEGVNGAFAGMERVVFVNFDEVFEGHRFCEEGVVEPDYGREETWFFLPGGADTGNGNETVVVGQRDGWLREDERHLVDTERCLKWAEKGGDWGERALCYMAAVKERSPEERLRGGEVGDSSWRAPTYYGKTFHPRSRGHEAIRDHIYQMWRQHGIKLAPQSGLEPEVTHRDMKTELRR